MTNAGAAKSYLGLYDQAVSWFRRSIEANRNYPVTYFWLAAGLAQLGRLDDAHSAVKAGLALDPTFAISRVRASWPTISGDPTFLAYLEPVLDGLRKAGSPRTMTAARRLAAIVAADDLQLTANRGQAHATPGRHHARPIESAIRLRCAARP